MNRLILPNPVSPNPIEIRQCSICRVGRNIEHFFRKGKVWRTCNKCSAEGAAWRKKQTADASLLFGQQPVWSWRLAELGTSQHERQLDLILQQSDSERRHQQQATKQWKEQRDPQMALNFLVNNPDLFSPSPLELSEQQQRLKHETQHLFHSHALLPGSTFENPVSYQNTQPELHVEPFRTYDSSASEVMNESMDTLIDYGVMEPNFYCNLFDPADPGQQDFRCNYSWSNSDPDLDLQSDYEEMCIGAQGIDLDNIVADGLTAHGIPPLSESVLLKNENGISPLPGSVLLNEEGIFVSSQLAYRSDSMLQNQPNDCFLPSYSCIGGATSYPETSQEMDVDTVDTDIWLTLYDTVNPVDAVAQAQTEAPVKRIRKIRGKPTTVNFDSYFADFDPAQDLLRQPTSPAFDLTGELLAKHLTYEIGLAIRLSELHSRWRKLRSIKGGAKKWFQEIETLDRLEERRAITPWRPLSNWFFVYEIQYEDILDRCVGVLKPWQAKRRRLAEERVLIRSLMDSWGEEVSKLIQDNTKALLDVLVDLTGQDGPDALKALDKHIRVMKNKVAKDCSGNNPYDNVLYLDVHKTLGVYIQGDLRKTGRGNAGHGHV